MPRGAMAPGRRRPATGRSRGWADLSVVVRNPAEAAAVLGRALANRYPLVWDEEQGRLRSIFWKKRTKARLAAGEECGQPVSEILSEAAHDWGLSYTSLHRLTHTRTARVISWRSLVKLQRILRPDEWRAFENAVFTQQRRRAMREYGAYLDREVARVATKRQPKHDVLLSQLDEGERGLWDRFRQDLQRLGAPAPRWQLAVLRIYDPIVGWRRLRERLSSKERLWLVRSGLKRERELVRKELTILRSRATGA